MKIHQRARQTDAVELFDVLTSPELLEKTEALLPAHRERLYPLDRALLQMVAVAEAMSKTAPCSLCRKAAWRILTAAILLSATSWPGSVAADCLRYGVVNLTGRLVQQTYPGPPDYESVTKGDEPRVIWVLQLDRGICIAGSDSSYPSAYSEREIQLVLGTDQYARAPPYAQYRHLLGEKITVTGRLRPGGARYEKRFVVAPHEIKRARLQP